MALHNSLSWFVAFSLEFSMIFGKTCTHPLPLELLEKPQTEGKEGKTLILDRIVEFQQSTGIKLMVIQKCFLSFGITPM